MLVSPSKGGVASLSATANDGSLGFALVSCTEKEVASLLPSPNERGVVSIPASHSEVGVAFMSWLH